MYSSRPNLTLGFHGSDDTIAEKVLQGKFDLKNSENAYDWLGPGIYFWENSPERALKWAKENARRGGVKPAVIGAVIDLGFCLDLLDDDSITTVRAAYEGYRETCDKAGLPLPQNREKDGHLLYRPLDCAVIKFLHSINEDRGNRPFDSVRGVFTEGDPVYEGSGFLNKSHIQICIRNPNCVKGYFRVRHRVQNYALP